MGPNKLYTYDEIEEISGIKRLIIGDWIFRKFINPPCKTKGGRNQHLFNQEGLTQIICFKFLVSRGFTRRLASELVKGED